MSQIVDITGWTFEELNVSGSKEKRWYRFPNNNKLGLFKLPVSITSDTWIAVDEMSGEMWSEKIASEIGNIMGFDVHQVEIGSINVDDEIIKYYGLNPDKIKSGIIYGAFCHSFLHEGVESLIEGADMIMEIDYTYDRSDLKGQLEVYSYDLLTRLFNKYNYLDELYKMIVFDTLIGNTDRHQDNFGIIRNEFTHGIRFAPLYDNSSSLGRELKEERIRLMLRDPSMFNSYLFGKKSGSLIKWGNRNHYEKLNIFDLFRRITEETPDIKKYINNLSELTDEIIEKIITGIPSVVMSDLKKEFVLKLIKTRRDYMLKEFGYGTYI
ncbi:HipA domain-containing protein [Brevibacillus fortis]|uniref:HipA domain-containing protein n=1 Tax=Brevibacillus fortis TaxID=2126352 RepID=UPI002E1F34A6|nr:HipA domain-containing protein [Brevibacillus fortis]